MTLEEDSKSVMAGTFGDNDVAVVNVRLNIVLVEVVLQYRVPGFAVIVCRETDLTR